MAESQAIGELARLAEQASVAGRLDEAAKAWDRVLVSAPEHPKALYFFGQMALLRGDVKASRGLLSRAAAAATGEPMIALALARACHAEGDAAAEADALRRALAIDPYCYPALLMQAALLEQSGHARQAARIYRDALKILPPETKLPAELRELALHARRAVQDNTAALQDFLHERLGTVRDRNRGVALDRFDECVAAMTGRGKIFVQQPTLLNFPHLPAITFYDRAMFDWLPSLEAETAAVREELLALLKERENTFRPYLDHPEGVPLNELAQLNHSMDWSALFLTRDGTEVAENRSKCPHTSAVLDSLPRIQIPGYAPAAFFSALKPHAQIPPHSGVTNARLIVHLPLIVPGPARFRVGNDTRNWSEGEAWVFDDTIEHEAWNDADELRVLLIFDIWNPLLSAAEREMVAELLIAWREYYGGAEAWG